MAALAKPANRTDGAMRETGPAPYCDFLMFCNTA
jgi:hypothetical protein